jgi:hypothetical protein
MVCVCLPLAVGCGDATVISGTVTYEGQLVDNGAITFLPVDGRGPSAGGPIVKGNYRVAGLKPGQKTVQIVGVKAVPFVRSSEEMARMAAEAAQHGDATGIIDRADEIPSDAMGNNARIEVKAGKQERDFHLKQPEGKPPTR